jgi:xanthine dehydrogenase YagT iron-sulfur-binding subunit
VDATISLTVDGRRHHLTVDTRTTVLDALRERLDVTNPKKGCDHGQCGACTVLLTPADDRDGSGRRRVLSCLALAVAHDGDEVTTAGGLAPDGELHPVAESFLDHDAYQCGYCTPGQLCSAVGMLSEADAGWPSLVTTDLEQPTVAADLDAAEVRERLSGNLCRCGAYANIVPAVLAAVTQGDRK